MKIKQNLTNQKWQFKQANEKIWLSATVPGCVHHDLRDHHIIEDPFYGKNELDMQWIDKKDWEYKTVFDVSNEMLSKEVVVLIFEGLDTYADIYLNDHKLIETNNMFRTWNIDVKPFLSIGENTLRIYFHSPINRDMKKPNELGYNLPAVNDHSEDGEVGENKLSVFARKAPYHYGWDWGPRFVTSGIWKDVYLQGWSVVNITDFHIQQSSISTEVAQLTAVLEIKSTVSKEITIEIKDTDSERAYETYKLEKGTNSISVPITIAHPKLWWTRELGEQNLYTFYANILDEDDILAEVSVQTGLRQIQLIRNKDKYGTTFQFELNGIPIFAKGANHIPNDSFQTDVTEERYRHEIATAAASNMNMLRVWGGGIYEYDLFYQLCDEYGILVWQDFMFACSMYPGDQSFLENVRQEAIDNVKRLRNYACIALWCGNNEMDAAWSEYDEDGGWGWKELYTREQREVIWKAYDDIFHHILPDVVEELDPTTDYWPSSPMQDLSQSKAQHATFDSLQQGDIHYWDVWHGLKPLEEYKKYVGRFMSEYGFQSFPEKKTVLSYAEENDLELESEVMLHHQKNGDGNRLIKNYMQMYYKDPKDFSSFLYLSQTLQADAIKSAIEAHRLNKPFCMGTLYWQLNDCWPVASWASMDYYGRWKALQYTVKDRYKDIALIIDKQGSECNFYIVSDILDNVSAELTIKLFDRNGNLLYENKELVLAGANTSTLVKSEKVDKIIQYKKQEQPIVLRGIIEANKKLIDAVDIFFEPIKDLTLEKPNITYELIEEDGVTCAYLKSEKLAKDVWLETDKEGYFSENKFNLIPGEKKKIHFFERSSNVNSPPFISGDIAIIKITSMYDYVI